MTRRLVQAGALAVVAGIVVGGVGVTLGLQRLSAREPAGAELRTFVVERGASLGRVAWLLEQEGLIRDARAFRWWAHLRGVAEGLKAGEYALSPSWSSRRILDRLVQGTVVTYELVLPEGIRAVEIARRVEEAGLGDAARFLEAALDPDLARQLGVPADGLEGYLFPETYRLPRGLPEAEIARAMVEQFHRAWEEVSERAAHLRLSMHEIVTLASIVEKETGAAEERPLIAAVFLNRMDRGMRLETDPTVIYGIPEFDGNLTRRHLRDAANPYNTYRHPGLPPGPIASPGLDALRAVVEPADSDYLYFVSMNDGTHKFSRTYREHAAAVDRYQRRRSSR